MDAIYLLVTTLLLYIFFGTVVDVFISTETSTSFFHVQTKVIFHTYIAPIMFSLILLFAVLTGNKTVDIFFGCVLFLGSMIKIISTNRRYLTEINVCENSVTISYLTPLLKSKSRLFNLADISTFEVTKGNWLIDHPAALNVKYKEQFDEFEIIDKKLKAKVQTDINAANMNCVKNQIKMMV